MRDDGPYPDRITRSPNADAVGKIQIAAGVAAITSATVTVLEPLVGDFVYRGDAIETGADGSVVIQFVDDTKFQLHANGRIEFGASHADVETRVISPLVRVVRGVFGFIAGKAATDARLIID